MYFYRKTIDFIPHLIGQRLRFDKKNISVLLNGQRIDTNRRKLGAIIGDDVQTGINSMMDIGTIVGDNCFIGPGALVQGEIKPDSKIM